MYIINETTQHAEQSVIQTLVKRHCQVSKQRVHGLCLGTFTRSSHTLTGICWIPWNWIQMKHVCISSSRKVCSFQVLENTRYLTRVTGIWGHMRVSGPLQGNTRRRGGNWSPPPPTDEIRNSKGADFLKKMTNSPEKDATTCQHWAHPLLSCPHLLSYTGTTIKTSWTFWGQSWNPREYFLGFLQVKVMNF